VTPQSGGSSAPAAALPASAKRSPDVTGQYPAGEAETCQPQAEARGEEGGSACRPDVTGCQGVECAGASRAPRQGDGGGECASPLTLPASTHREDLPPGNWRQAGCALCGKLGPWVLDDGPDAGPGTDLVKEPMLAAGFREEIDEVRDEDDQLVERTRHWLCNECHEGTDK